VSTCVTLAVGGTKVIVGYSGSSVDKLSIYNCSSLTTCTTPNNPLDLGSASSISVDALAITNNFFFCSDTSDNNNAGKVSIYHPSGTSWSYVSSLKGGGGDQFGKYVDVTRNGNLLAVYADNAGTLSIYYLDFFGNWALHTTLDPRLSKNLSVKNINIRQTELGYVVIASASSSDTHTDARIYIFNVTCSRGYYGITCTYPCTCSSSHGECNSTMWSTGTCKYCIGAYYGSNCNSQCTCQNGVCNNSINGNGMCLSCSSSFYGPNCATPLAV